MYILECTMMIQLLQHKGHKKSSETASEQNLPYGEEYMKKGILGRTTANLKGETVAARVKFTFVKFLLRT